MSITTRFVLPTVLTIGAALFSGGCTPPAPPRPANDSGVTDIESEWEATSVPEEEYVIPSVDPVGALPVEAPAESPVEPAAQAAAEMPKRELKPTDEPAPGDDEELLDEMLDETLDESEQWEPDETPAEAADEAGEPADAPAAPKPETAEPAAEPAAATAPAAAAPATGDRVVSGDWPCWGGDVHRNMVNSTTGIATDFQPAPTPEEGQRLLWVAKLGSQTYGNPVVADGRVYVGTNNGAEYRPQHQGDRGCLLCFDEKTGEFQWQLTREKLAQGKANDWPEQGICSAPFVEGNRLWVVTNRCELMCVDTEGFADQENDGPFTAETDAEPQDADIVWVLDMMEKLQVYPHNLATSSPIVIGDLVYILTSNGVDESHEKLPSPEAPSFLAVHKVTGEVVWQDNSPLATILHGQWSSPAAGVVNGQTQIYMPAGNGWLYALDALTGEHLWKFDLNPKDSKWELGGRGTRNSIIATPVFFDNSVVLASGQDPEYGDGVGHLYRIDATKRGDVSPVTPDNQPNPNSAQIWHWGGIDTDGSLTGEKDNECFRRTLSTVAIHDGLVYAPDLSGRIHCLDFATGKRYWEADILAAVWGSPMVADGKMFLGDEDGILSVFATGKEENKIGEIEFPSSIYSTPVIANGVMFISDRSRLYAIRTQ